MSQQYGTQPLGIVHTRTPFRISFFGGGSDFPDYFNPNKGIVIGSSIDKYSYVVINSLVRLEKTKIKLSYSELEHVDKATELQHPIARCVLSKYQSFWKNAFLDIHSFADIPSGSGMGSSSAFTVGLLQGLAALHGKYKSPFQLASESIDIERNKLNEAGGWQDQIFAAYGDFLEVQFRNNEFDVSNLVFSQEKKKALEQSMLCFYTNTQRSSCQIQSAAFSKENINSKHSYLDKMVDIACAARDVLYSSQSLDSFVYEFGKMLHESWLLKCNISPYISTDCVSKFYEVAMANGAYGGKLCGAGGGGVLVFIAPKKSHQDIYDSLTNLGLKYMQVKFSSSGSRIIFMQHMS